MPLDLIMCLPVEESESHGATDVFVRDMKKSQPMPMHWHVST